MTTLTTHVEPAIHVSGLRVSAGRGKQQKCLLGGIGFDAYPGQFIAVIGASGCGKSTLIKALAGQLPITTGRILFAGHPISDLRVDFPLAVGYLPQFGAVHPELTVAEGISQVLALRLPRSVPAEVREGWHNHIVELARIEAFLEQPYRTLSGGQMRRAALAEEMVGDPAFLLGSYLHEPVRHPIQKHGSVVVVGRQAADTWIVVNKAVMGRFYGKTWRRLVVAEQADVAFVDSPYHLPESNEMQTVVLAGNLSEEEVQIIRAYLPRSKLVILNPRFAPDNLLTLTNSEADDIIVYRGSFFTTPWNAAWDQAIPSRVSEAQGAAEYLPEWPKLINSSNLQADTP